MGRQMVIVSPMLVAAVFASPASGACFNPFTGETTDGTPNLARGAVTFEQLRRGERTIEQLSSLERCEMSNLLARIPTTCGASDECCSARKLAEQAADEAITAADDYAQCLRNRRSEDSCNQQMQAARNYHDEYETAVSKVSRSC